MASIETLASPVESARILFGASPHCDYVVPSLYAPVSAYLTVGADGLCLHVLNDVDIVLVDGQHVRSADLSASSRLRLGDFESHVLDLVFTRNVGSVRLVETAEIPVDGRSSRAFDCVEPTDRQIDPDRPPARGVDRSSRPVVREASRTRLQLGRVIARATDDADACVGESRVSRAA